jgi:surface protein
LSGGGYTVKATYVCSSADTEGDISYIVKYFPYGGGEPKIFLPNSNDSATSVIFDKTPPTLTTVSIVSNNSYDNSLGKPGDTVTLTFTASEQLKNSPVITFKSNGYGVGGPITTTNIINTTWISQYTIRDTDIEGLITFKIEFRDLSNIAGVSITETTNSTGVIFSVNNKVVISADGVALINNSITDSLTHELIFTITEPTNDFTIDNIITTNNTLSNFKKDPSGNNKKYTATSVSIGGWNYIRIEGGTFRSLAGNMNVTTDFSWKFQINLVDSNIRDAVNTWVSDSTKAIDLYGHIINWDTSNITDMSGLFKNKTLFNNDITNWDTTKVTDMSEMFKGAAAFNQNIETVKNLPGGGAKWNTDKVSSMRYMFYGATAFNQDLSSWEADLGNSDITGFSSKFGGKNNIYNINKTIKDTWEFKL